MPTKEKEFAYITGFSSNVYKTISAAEARISTSGGIKLAVSQADRLRSACLLAINDLPASFNELKFIIVNLVMTPVYFFNIVTQMYLDAS